MHGVGDVVLVGFGFWIWVDGVMVVELRRGTTCPKQLGRLISWLMIHLFSG